jgi:RNA polymerase sigma-70 factor (ECF subfamily)
MVFMEIPMSSSSEPNLFLDQISTVWSIVHDPTQFVLRYAPAIRGYLVALLKNQHDAEDLAQQFLLRVVEHGFTRVQLKGGRFRDYLKASVRNAALSFLQRQHGRQANRADLSQVADEQPDPQDADRQWIRAWRKCLLNRAMQALEMLQRQAPGNLCHTVLQVAMEHPQENSQALAAHTSQRIGRPLRPEAYRQQLSRARRRLAQLLVNQVAQSLEQPPPEQVIEELIALDLLRYVRDFLPADWHTSGEWLKPG